MAYDWDKELNTNIKHYSRWVLSGSIVGMLLGGISLIVFGTSLDQIIDKFGIIIPAVIVVGAILIIIFNSKTSRAEKYYQQKIDSEEFQELYERAALLAENNRPEMKEELGKIMKAQGEIKMYQYRRLLKDFKNKGENI